MTDQPEFILLIVSIEWIVCISIYVNCVETVETESKQPETTKPEQVESDQFAPMIDGVVDWGLVDKKVKK